MAISKPLPDFSGILQNLAECPHPGKVSFGSEATARSRAEDLDFGYYKCACGAWHLTSQWSVNDCPICGAPLDEYTSCGCYEELHYGRD